MKDIISGSEQLLVDSISILAAHDEEYVIIGGWCPYLRAVEGIGHPGTIDVDILFQNSYETEGIKVVIESFLDAGFCPSAKHRFQLNRQYRIGEREFTFHIDLLHPQMLNEPGDLFVDHLDLDVPFKAGDKHNLKMRSIVLPYSRTLFDQNMFTEEVFDEVKFNLISYEGMVLTKMDSCQQSKRERDSFDIFKAFKSEGFSFDLIRDLADSANGIGESIARFSEYLEKFGPAFNSSAAKYMPDNIVCDSNSDPAGFILSQIRG